MPRPGPRREFVGARMTQEQIAALDEKAESENVDRSEIIRRAVDAYVRKAATVVVALVALMLLSGCGSTESASEPRESVAVQTSTPVVVASQASTETPSCWSMATSTWMADYNKLRTDLAAAVVVLDALPDPHYGCTAADVADLVRAHALAERIRPTEG